MTMDISQFKFKEFESNIKQLLLKLGVRGILIMLGLRKTTGSQDIPWPHSNILLQNFNSPNQLVSVEEI